MKQPDWANKLDRFLENEGFEYNASPIHEIKDFIRQTLLSQKEELKKMIEERLKELRGYANLGTGAQYVVSELNSLLIKLDKE